MPQLDTLSWLHVLSFLWFVFLALLIPILLSIFFPNHPGFAPNYDPNNPWTWFWK